MVYRLRLSLKPHTRTLLALLAALGWSAQACTLLFQAHGAQCATTDDCRAYGSAFASTVCSAGECIVDDSAGGSGASECSTNAECIDANFGNPYVCKDGQCVSLTLDPECPLVVGAGQNYEYLRTEAPIIIGAYSYVDPAAPRQSVPTLNYELALDEVNEKTRGGLPGGPNGVLRPFVAVICRGTGAPDLEASAQHLTETLRVPAILSSLFTKDLVSTFLSYGAPNGTFFLSPLESDSTLANTEDDGLLWHLLPSALDLAPAYLPLLSATETHLRTSGNLADSEALRVALVDADTPFLQDMADYFVENAEFNGTTIHANATEGNFLRLRTDSQIEVAEVDTADALADLLDFAPHVVVGIGSGELVGLVDEIEAGWPLEGQARPFYLVSPYVFGRSDLANDALAGVRGRTLGVKCAAATDTRLYDLYLARLESTYDVAFNLAGAENFYDASYFLMMAVAGAGNPSVLTGREIALGMRRLVGGKTSYDVGPTDASDAVGYLRGSADSTFSLQGTMGPPDFNTSTGARRGLPSIYCIDSNGAYVQNAMTFNPTEGTLVGSPPCIPGFAE